MISALDFFKFWMFLLLFKINIKSMIAVKLTIPQNFFSFLSGLLNHREHLEASQSRSKGKRQDICVQKSTKNLIYKNSDKNPLLLYWSLKH